MDEKPLLESIDRAIEADEQRRSDLLFQLGKVNGRLEMARAIRAELLAPSPVSADDVPTEKEGKNDAG